MPTPAQIRATVEQRMRAVLADLRQRQNTHHAMTGRYWQGPRTHDTLPSEGVGLAPDLTKSVEGEESWASFGVNLPALLECAFHVDAYDGARGDGYTVTATVMVLGKTWQRTANVGPERHRSTGWEQVGNGG